MSNGKWIMTTEGEEWCWTDREDRFDARWHVSVPLSSIRSRKITSRSDALIFVKKAYL
jgi:hypothetical protein